MVMCSLHIFPCEIYILSYKKKEDLNRLIINLSMRSIN